MSQPTDPWQPARAETAAFPAAEGPPLAPVAPVAQGPATPAPTRRSRVLMAAAAAGLLAVGVVVGLVVGQATAGTASAGDLDPATSQTVPGTVPDDGSGYGSLPGGGTGGMPQGGRGGTGRLGGVPGQGAPDGGGTTDGGSTDDTVDGTALDS